jgi:hypothetical protein
MTKVRSVVGDIDMLTIASIKANAVSLLGQLADYSHLTISPAQAKALDNIEEEFHQLVKEITQDEPNKTPRLKKSFVGKVTKGWLHKGDEKRIVMFLGTDTLEEIFELLYPILRDKKIKITVEELGFGE